jgi:hypothetical protein
MGQEQALKLIELMISMGYESMYIEMVLVNCELGMGIGHALQKTRHEWFKEVGM